MAEEARIRSFIAVDVDAAVRARLGTLEKEFTRTKADVRWVRPEGLHVTLKFMGAVEHQRLQHVHAALMHALDGLPALHLNSRGLGAFPSLRRPRVIWVGLHGAGLADLAARVEETLLPLGFEKEARAFTPHLTLGRVRSLHAWPQLEELIKAHLDDDFGDSDVAGVTIYRSTLLPGGAVYTPLWTMPLTGNKEGVYYDTGR